MSHYNAIPQSLLRGYFDSVRRANDESTTLVKGRRVRILSASHYNGQPFGSSRPALRGKVFTVEAAHVDNWGMNLKLKGERLSIRAGEVEFLEPDTACV